jgi:hypothetical protein
MLLMASGCSYVLSVSQTNVPANRSHPVEASVSKLIFFGTTENDEVLAITRKLRDKCPNGAVRGILTKYYQTVYFLFIYEQNTEATGYCVTGGNVAEEENQTRPVIGRADADGGAHDTHDTHDTKYLGATNLEDDL